MVHLRIATCLKGPRRWRSSINSAAVTPPVVEDYRGGAHRKCNILCLFHTPNDFCKFKVGDYVLCRNKTKLGTTFSVVIKQSWGLRSLS